MKTRWTTHSWNGAIWLALRPCHITMTCEINKLEKPGGPLGIFHALFGRSAAFYGHFQVDTVTSELCTRISSSTLMNIFWPASLSTFSWCFWREFSQSWNNLRKTLQSHENLWSLTYLSGANIGFHSNSRDWLFWVFMMSKINPLMNKSVLFWQDV